MNFNEKEIKRILTKKISEPIDYERKIKSTLYIEREKKIFKKWKLLLTIGNIGASILLCSSLAFASYNIYEKIWKEPKKINSYQEYENSIATKIEDDKINRSEELENASNSGKIISQEEAIECANTLLNKIGYNDIVLTTENIKYNDIDSKHSYKLYYVIKTDDDVNKGIEIKLGADGTLYSFVNKDISLDYNIKPDSISKNEGINISKNLFSNIGIESEYNLDTVEEISHYFGNLEKKEWWAKYIKKYDNITNEYEIIEFDFFVENGKTIVEQILVRSLDYQIDNNEIIIDENTAINIALEEDRKISQLEIKNVETSLQFKELNSFVYVQEKAKGVSDGITAENETGMNYQYNEYQVNSNKLRKVYNVKIKYIIDEQLMNNTQERYGREYFVDATTGEIIGGKWGDI